VVSNIFYFHPYLGGVRSHFGSSLFRVDPLLIEQLATLC